MPVGEAMHQAKKRMSRITIAEIRADEDLRQIAETAGRGKISGRDAPESSKPFAGMEICQRPFSFSGAKGGGV